MNITIRTIPHDQQRYETVGDWQQTIAGLDISMSPMSNQRYESLVALLAIVATLLCQQTGGDQAVVDKFDRAYEASRPEDNTTSEPSDHPCAPYRRQHVIARSSIWRGCCSTLDLAHGGGLRARGPRMPLSRYGG